MSSEQNQWVRFKSLLFHYYGFLTTKKNTPENAKEIVQLVIDDAIVYCRQHNIDISDYLEKISNKGGQNE